MREEIRILVERAKAEAEGERTTAEREIVRRCCEYSRQIANICGHIAEMYAFAETAWKAKNYNLAADALAKVRELEAELDKVREEEREWNRAFWEVMRRV